MRFLKIHLIRPLGITIALILALSLMTVPVLAQDSGKPATGKAKSAKKGEICITFNELPVAAGFGDADAEAITYLLLEALKKHDVKAAGFVVGSSIDGAFDALGRWLNDGHVLGNMTYSNQDIDDLGIEQFINDVRMGADALEPMLSGFGQKKRYFRYPFLHYGSTVDVKKQVGLYIDHAQYVLAHATVVPEDYLYNFSLEKLGKTPDSAKFENLLNEYINHVLDEVERAEQNAKEIVGRPVRQILLLRANRLNAVYIDEMLKALKDMGYKFITLDRALKDRVFDRTEAYFDTKGVGYLDMIKLSDPDLLPAE